MKKTVRLRNLDCAVCASELEEEIGKIDGVHYVSVSFIGQKLTVDCASEVVFEKVLYTASHFEEVEVVEEGVVTASHKKLWPGIAISAILFIIGVLFTEVCTKKSVVIVGYIAFAFSYISVGYSVLFTTAKNLAKGKIFDENFLMTVASIGAVFIGEVFEGVAVMLLYQIGETLQSLAIASSRKNIAGLMDLKSEYATIVLACDDSHCGHEHIKQVPPEEVKIGDLLLVKAGEKIPVDGVLVDNTAVLDTKSLTGESDYKKCVYAEEILSGCINVGGVFTMRATRLYAESAVQKILDLVENASEQKARPEKFITKFARIYTPIVCFFALFVAFILPLASGLIVDGRFYLRDFHRWLRSALTFLVVSCPCALVISVPLTYFSGIGSCARQGILVKGATFLDVMAKSKRIAFDKTGTLTEGDFTVCGIRTSGSKEELLSLVTAVEKNSTHPIAKAFEKFASKYEAKKVEEIAGRGLRAEINHRLIFVGNALLMKENGIEFREEQSVYTLIYVAENGKYIGCIEVGDKIREEAIETIQALKKLGFNDSIMLTGDGDMQAEKTAKEVGVYAFKAGLLPADKLSEAEKLKENGELIYVGDGINDAPIMATADCAISMGNLASDVAVEASDVVLLTDDLRGIPGAIKIARKTRKIVWQNILFSIAMKILFMALGALGVLPLWLAVFADVGVMLLSVLNALRARKKI